MFENRREQERCELILKSITEEKCEQGLYTYLSKCQVLNKPIVKNICLTNKHLDINSDVASCKVKGEVTFFYKGKNIIALLAQKEYLTQLYILVLFPI